MLIETTKALSFLEYVFYLFKLFGDIQSMMAGNCKRLDGFVFRNKMH